MYPWPLTDVGDAIRVDLDHAEPARGGRTPRYVLEYWYK